MLRISLFVLTAVTALGADHGWDKVRELKTGAELRIYKTGAKQPILATMDEATADHIVVVFKKEQVGIDKDEIERIDARPHSGSRITRETRTTSDLPQPVGPGPRGSTPGPQTSSSSSVNMGSKPDFETIYRRTAGDSSPGK